jgi:hypothetical protein
LVNFVNDNEDHLETIQELHSKCKAIEDEIFSCDVNKDITVPPLKEYIENWLKNSLSEITNPP